MKIKFVLNLNGPSWDTRMQTTCIEIRWPTLHKADGKHGKQPRPPCWRRPSQVQKHVQASVGWLLHPKKDRNSLPMKFLWDRLSEIHTLFPQDCWGLEQPTITARTRTSLTPSEHKTFIFQAMVSSILPSTTAITGCAIGLPKTVSCCSVGFLTVSHWCSSDDKFIADIKLYCARLSAVAAQSASTDNIKSLESWQNCFKYLKQMCLILMLCKGRYLVLSAYVCQFSNTASGYSSVMRLKLWKRII